MSSPRYVIIADGDFGPMTSKTANSVIRYQPERVVAVLDRRLAGKTVESVLGFGGSIPVVGSIEEGLALGPDAVLIGIAPLGGRLPDEWRAWLAQALDHGCDLCSRFRRRAVYEIARGMGANVIAFGHTADDLCESLFRNILYTGRISSLPPVTGPR